MKVTLKYPHTHAGQSYTAGATLDVGVLDAIWLKGRDLIEEGIQAIEAEARKLASKEQPAPHAAEIAALKTKVAPAAITPAAPAAEEK